MIFFLWGFGSAVRGSWAFYGVFLVEWGGDLGMGKIFDIGEI